MNTIEWLEHYKTKLNNKMHERMREINTYPCDTECNWRLSEIQKISEDIQHYTNAIFALKKLGDKK